MHAHPNHPVGAPRLDGYGRGPWRILAHLAVTTLFGLVLTTSAPVWAQTIHCGAGDVPCLIAAINQANAQAPQPHTIVLAAGTYPLTQVDNTTDGPNGLPSITSHLTIVGQGASQTIIERDPSLPPNTESSFRLFHVAASGHLTLEQLTIQGGSLANVGGGDAQRGAGLFNAGGSVVLTETVVANNYIELSNGGAGLVNRQGTLFVNRSAIVGNMAAVSNAGGIANENGTLTMFKSTVADNMADIGGGINAGGTVIILDSAIVGNSAASGGGIHSSGWLILINSTVAENRTRGGDGGGIKNLGTAQAINSTIAGNTLSSAGGQGGGIFNKAPGVVTLQNTILALNAAPGSSSTVSDCFGPATSFGNNLIGDPSGCTMTLQPTDLTGDPGLGPFTDNGTPGNGHFPLLPGSQAIDAGNDAVCPRRDQLGERRIRPCDIGSIAFPEDQESP